MHFERRSDPFERVNRDVFFAALDVPDVVVVQFGFFGQLLLAPFEIPPVRPDVFPKDLAIFRNFYHP